MDKCIILTVAGLKKILADWEKDKQINSKTKIWLSSDEEGNSFSPVVLIPSKKEGEAMTQHMINASADKSQIIFYPSSAHSVEDPTEKVEDK